MRPDIKAKPETAESSDAEPRENERPRGSAVSETVIDFRPMIASDVERVMEIERASFPYPWSQAFFYQELKVSCASAVLALAGEQAIGYVIYWLVSGEVDIHNLAVHPGYRRRGVARALLHWVIGDAKERGAGRITLEVRKSNTGAQDLYRSLGFAEQGVRKGYYSDDGEDALAMALDL